MGARRRRAPHRDLRDADVRGAIARIALARRPTSNDPVSDSFSTSSASSPTPLEVAVKPGERQPKRRDHGTQSALKLLVAPGIASSTSASAPSAPGRSPRKRRAEPTRSASPGCCASALGGISAAMPRAEPTRRRSRCARPRSSAHLRAPSPRRPPRTECPLGVAVAPVPAGGPIMRMPASEALVRASSKRRKSRGGAW